MQRFIDLYEACKKSRRRDRLRLIAKVVGMLLWVPFLVLTLISAYGGFFNPETHPWIAILEMCFPGFIITTVIITVICFFTKLQWGGFVGAIATLICIGAIVTYTPVQLFHNSDGSREDEFKVMTWNVLWWYPYDDEHAASTPNPDMQAVLDANPDVLVLQESDLVKPDTLGITQEQYEEFSRRYKYKYIDDSADLLALYSRYPFTCTPENGHLGGSGVYVKYTFDIRGHRLTLFNLHLQTIGLSKEDASLYVQLLKGIPAKSEVRDAKNVLYDKLIEAYKLRAQQARNLREILNKVEGNLIVCGDFNDIPGSYAVRRIQGFDLHDAYVDAGFGPGISYRSYNMFFRIDHILYRGDFDVVNAKRLKVGQSDHYPLLAVFRWKNPGKSETIKKN